jgi:putative YphP/YqiW family bacilliredoxin
MRQELTSAGVAEARTADQVSQAVQQKGTVMVVVNSVCGCAAGKMRPGVRAAIQNGVRPERMITVFAGQDREATETARSFFTGYPPSSPSIGILRDGQLVYMMERRDIEMSSPEMIASALTRAFDQFCAKEATSK